jgi:hypothetical protein
MEKTLRQWFEMFPEPYRTQAIENTIALIGETQLEQTAQSAADAIECAFNWHESSQGANYWKNFYDQGEIVLTEPSEGGKQ